MQDSAIPRGQEDPERASVIADHSSVLPITLPTPGTHLKNLSQRDFLNSPSTWVLIAYSRPCPMVDKMMIPEPETYSSEQQKLGASK